MLIFYKIFVIIFIEIKKRGFLKMLIIAVLAVLCAGFGCAGMSFVGARSFVKSRDWHYAVGAVLYALGAVLFIGWVFSMSY